MAKRTLDFDKKRKTPTSPIPDNETEAITKKNKEERKKKRKEDLARAKEWAARRASARKSTGKPDGASKINEESNDKHSSTRYAVNSRTRKGKHVLDSDTDHDEDDDDTALERKPKKARLETATSDKTTKKKTKAELLKEARQNAAAWSQKRTSLGPSENPVKTKPTASSKSNKPKAEIHEKKQKLKVGDIPKNSQEDSDHLNHVSREQHEKDVWIKLLQEQQQKNAAVDEKLAKTTLMTSSNFHEPKIEEHQQNRQPKVENFPKEIQKDVGQYLKQVVKEQKQKDAMNQVLREQLQKDEANLSYESKNPPTVLYNDKQIQPTSTNLSFVQQRIHVQHTSSKLRQQNCLQDYEIKEQNQQQFHDTKTYSLDEKITAIPIQFPKIEEKVVCMDKRDFKPEIQSDQTCGTQGNSIMKEMQESNDNYNRPKEEDEKKNVYMSIEGKDITKIQENSKVRTLYPSILRIISKVLLLLICGAFIFVLANLLLSSLPSTLEEDGKNTQIISDNTNATSFELSFAEYNNSMPPCFLDNDMQLNEDGNLVGQRRTGLVGCKNGSTPIPCPNFGFCTGGKLISCTSDEDMITRLDPSCSESNLEEKEFIEDDNKHCSIKSNSTLNNNLFNVSEDGSACVLSQYSLNLLSQLKQFIVDQTLEVFCGSWMFRMKMSLSSHNIWMKAENDEEISYDLKGKTTALFSIEGVAEFLACDVEILTNILSVGFDMELDDDLVLEKRIDESKDEKLAKSLWIGLSQNYMQNKLTIPFGCWFRILLSELLGLSMKVTAFILKSTLLYLWSFVWHYPLHALSLSSFIFLIKYVRDRRRLRAGLRKKVLDIREIAYDKLILAGNVADGYAVLHLRDEIAHELFPQPCKNRVELIMKVWPIVVSQVKLDNRVAKSRKLVKGKSLDWWEWVSTSSKHLNNFNLRKDRS